jgi:ribosome biogenesis GTPase / thiamine phosphate phosphatase
MSIDLSSLGWDEGFARMYAPLAGPDRKPARVTRVDPGVCTGLSPGGVVRASLGGCILAASAADPARLPCPGDWVVVQHWPDERTTVERVLPRRTTIALAGTERMVTRLLAANVDTAAVVVAGWSAVESAGVMSLLRVARAAGIQAIVILTIPGRAAVRAGNAGRGRAVAPETDVYAVPGVSADLTRLRRHLAGGRTLALLGPSDTQRWKLINTLVGADVLAHGTCLDTDVGRFQGRGQVLIPVPGGGAIVDTPAVEVGRGRWGGARAALQPVRPAVNPSRGQKAGPKVDRADPR